MEQLLQDLRRQYPEAKLTEGDIIDNRPTIYIWIDDKILSQEKILHLQGLIKKAFGYTIFPIGYKLKFSSNRPNWKTFNNKYDIYVYLTDSEINNYVIEYNGDGKRIYHYNTGFGSGGGVTPGNTNYPIWVKIHDYNETIKFERIAFITMHELGHRITQFAAYSEVAWNELGVYRNDASIHDGNCKDNINLMMQSVCITKINTGNIEQWYKAGYFKLLEPRKKGIMKFLTHLKVSYGVLKFFN